MIGSFLLDFGKKKLSNERVLDFPALQNINNYLFLINLFSLCDTMAHFLLLRACSYLCLFTSLRDFWFVVSRELIKEVLDKAPPTSDALNFLFLLLRSIVLIVHNPCRLLAITCKLAMELKQGTRSKGQTRREEGMYEGWKRWRVMFICHKEKIKVWDRLENLLRNKERVERTGWWWFYTARIHIHCFFLWQREISHDQEPLIIASGLSINKPLMIDYICYFTIPRKSWTDSS